MWEPLSVTCFIVACRHRHYAVVASIFGFLVLKIVILLSTGVLVLRPSHVAHPFSTTITSFFAPGALWDNVKGLPRTSSGDPSDGSYYLNVSSLPIHEYSALPRDDPGGRAQSRSSAAYQTFEMPSVNGLEGLTLEVDLFRPEIACDIAQLSISTNRSHSAPHTTFGFQSGICSDSVSPYITCLSPSDPVCQQPAVSYWAWQPICDDSPRPTTRPEGTGIADSQTMLTMLCWSLIIRTDHGIVTMPTTHRRCLTSTGRLL